MRFVAHFLAVFVLLASTTCQDLSASDDDNLYTIHEFDAEYLGRAVSNLGSDRVPEANPGYTVERVRAKEELVAEREFATKYGVSIGYLREVQQRATQGRVGRIEAEDTQGKSEAENPVNHSDSENVSHEPSASPPPTIEATKNCDPPKELPDQRRPWKAPTRVKAASRPDNGAALMVLVVVVTAVVLTAFIVIMWCSYSCLV